MELIRRRWYACNIKGVPSWRCKIHSKHKNVTFPLQLDVPVTGVIEIVLANNHRLCLDVIMIINEKQKHEKNKKFYSGFLETSKPINGQLACYREEWELSF